MTKDLLPEKQHPEPESGSISDGRDLPSEPYHAASHLESQRNDGLHDRVELERIHTYRLQQQATVGSTRSRVPREQWLPMGAGKPYPPSLPHSDDYVVEFEGSDDPMHPQNWPMKRRYVR